MHRRGVSSSDLVVGGKPQKDEDTKNIEDGIDPQTGSRPPRNRVLHLEDYESPVEDDPDEDPPLGSDDQTKGGNPRSLDSIFRD